MIITVPRHPAKLEPTLIGPDERHLRRVAAALEAQITLISTQLDALRRAPAGGGTGALERDLDIHRLSARLRLVRRFGADACLGRMVPAGDPDHPVYIGRLGLPDPDGGEPLLVDWRAPASAAFFAATYARPQGLASRRRYRWSGHQVVDYWDEVFTADAPGTASLDEQSAFIASLGGARTPRMRDVLATIQADQDAIIRADAHGALVVDGGPGTGKTVAALHRAAYLVYADPRLRAGQGGVLVVGPHEPYLAYTADVLPSLGEEGVRTCTLRDLVPEGTDAIEEADPWVAALKGDVRMAAAVDPAVALYEEPPTDELEVETDAGDVVVGAETWAEAFASAGRNTPHNEARDDVWEALLDLIVDRHGDDAELPADEFRRSLARHLDLRHAFRRAWPLLEASDLVGDLWAVPAYLRRCAPWLTSDEMWGLTRPEGSPWTLADLPMLDAMRHRLGDQEAPRRRREREAAAAQERAYRSDLADYLIAHDPTEMKVMSMLRGPDLADALIGGEADAEHDPLAGPFAHVIVDEAQELTDAQWQLLLRRCPSRSFTVVGDRAQARAGFAESWAERLERVGFGAVRQTTLTINYRTPSEVMDAAAPVIRALLPDASVPVSVRGTGEPVAHGPVADLAAIVDAWLAEHDEGVACVIGAPWFAASGPGAERVASLPPEQAKGLEFDLVVLVDPDAWGDDVAATVDRYVAMTRATQRLVMLTT